MIDAPDTNRPGHHGRSRATISGAAGPKYRVRFHNRNPSNAARNAKISSLPAGRLANARTRLKVNFRYSELGPKPAASRSRVMNPKQASKMTAPIVLPAHKMSKPARRRPGAK